MEFRKEKSFKSKELIRKHFMSDIFNINTGYYKSEKIKPVSPKPNEYKQTLMEFIPRYKEEKHYERHFNNFLSDQQKHNPYFINLKPNHSHKNLELEIVRNRTKDLKKCYDNGKFSAKKLYILDVFKKKDEDNNHEIKKINKGEQKPSNSKHINDNKNNKRFSNQILLIKEMPKNAEFNTINNEKKIHNIHNIDKLCDNTNSKYNNNIKTISNFSPNPKKENLNNKNRTINPYNNNINIKNNYNLTKSVDLNKMKSSKPKIKKSKSEKKFYRRAKSSTESNKSMKNNIKRINRKKNNVQQFFNILIQDLKNDEFLIDKKYVNEIFYKNGLHLYDYNEDGMNGLFIDKKIEAKLRKNINDKNFDKNYGRVVKELEKNHIKIDKREMIDGQLFRYLRDIKKEKEHF